MQKIIFHYGKNLKNTSSAQLDLLSRQSQVLVLDEATASVDLETDSLVQRVIADHMASCTVVTVAHRMETLLCGSHRVMVLEEGTVKEFDSPFRLLEDRGSTFYSLARGGR